MKISKLKTQNVKFRYFINLSILSLSFLSFSFLSLSICTLIILSFSSCVNRIEKATTIRVKGSETMHKLMESLSEKYMELHPGIIIYVDGGSSDKGFEALNNGQADIAMTSRAINIYELKKLALNYSKVGVSHLVAKDVFGIYLNEKNTIQNLDLKDVKDIFTCKINNWNEIATYNGEIFRIVRSPNSGTYSYFQKFVLEGENYCDNSTTITNNRDIITAVEKNKNAIGYGSLIHKGDVKIPSINGYLPTEENINNDNYPLIRYLELYTRDEPPAEISNFIKWIQSKEGQKLIKQFGLIPIYKFSY